MRIGLLIGILCAMHLAGSNEIAFAATPSLIPGPGTAGSAGSALLAECAFHTGKLEAKCAPQYIAYLIEIIFQLTGAIFLLMIIIGGYQYVISKAGGGGGDEGKARVRYAIVGFLVTALSFYIVDFILNSFIP
jgi:cation transporter-like permease